MEGADAEEPRGDGGVVLTPGPDGSVMASSGNPGEAIYTVEANAVLPRITAIRLEALPDPSLPKGGPGRDIYGNFQLNRVEAAAQPLRTRGRRDGRPPCATAAPGFANLAFKAIKSDDGGASLDSFFPPALSRDLYAPRGWRIDASREDTRLPRQIVFTLDRPLDTPAGARLRIRLKHQGSVVGQSLGRFRLSVTSSSSPQRVVEIPARLRPILAIASGDRTEQQRKDLAAAIGPSRRR